MVILDPGHSGPLSQRDSIWGIPKNVKYMEHLTWIIMKHDATEVWILFPYSILQCKFILGLQSVQTLHSISISAVSSVGPFSLWRILLHLLRFGTHIEVCQFLWTCRAQGLNCDVLRWCCCWLRKNLSMFSWLQKQKSLQSFIFLGWPRWIGQNLTEQRCPPASLAQNLQLHVRILEWNDPTSLGQPAPSSGSDLTRMMSTPKQKFRPSLGEPSPWYLEVYRMGQGYQKSPA